MAIYSGLLQNHGPKTSCPWISFILLYSMLCMWTNVECWSYYYSNDTMDWQQARAWCREHYTDMVAIQNQEEIGHLNSWLPQRNTYYWIGIRKIDDVWTWVGTNKALTAEATNWAKDEPNNGKTVSGRRSSRTNEDCVEMYVKRREQAGKWNDERCEKRKTALCYTAACKNDSCLYGECVETINSHRCACFDGFYGEKCEHVVMCDKEEVTVPHKGSVNCTHKYGDFAYGSSCEYSCETGYQLSMPRPLRCTASTQWSDEPPTCEPIRCLELSPPAGGSVNCSNPLGHFSYQSTCVFTCDAGFVQVGSQSDTLQCDASGSWNASQPSCAAVQLENGFISCSRAEMSSTYENTCNFSCGPGYRLEGASSLTYASPAELSERLPRCKAITCQKPEGGAHLIPKCSNSSTEPRPGSTCSFTCASGFRLQGADVIQCSDDGQWSEAVPGCKAIECPAVEVPSNGQISCSRPLSSSAPAETPHPPGMSCTFSCDEGHELQGALGTQCDHTGQWTSSPPNCTVISCPSLAAPENGFISCADSGPVYNSQCSFTCSQGYALKGHELLTCDRHGNWTGDTPTCQATPSKIAAVVSGLATGGTLLSAVSLAIWILKRLKQKKNQFELNSSSDIEAPPQVYRNSTDSLI